MALGADPKDVLKLVVRDGVTLAVLGIAAGVAIALPATRLMAALLYGIEATDPAVFITVSLTSPELWSVRQCVSPLAAAWGPTFALVGREGMRCGGGYRRGRRHGGAGASTESRRSEEVGGGIHGG